MVESDFFTTITYVTNWSWHLLQQTFVIEEKFYHSIKNALEIYLFIYALILQQIFQIADQRFSRMNQLVSTNSTWYGWKKKKDNQKEVQKQFDGYRKSSQNQRLITTNRPNQGRPRPWHPLPSDGPLRAFHKVSMSAHWINYAPRNYISRVERIF